MPAYVAHSASAPRASPKKRGATATYKCRCCGNDFDARIADRKRGWALYCSKTCKAIKQEQRTGQYAAYQTRQLRGGRGNRRDGDDDFNWDPGDSMYWDSKD